MHENIEELILEENARESYSEYEIQLINEYFNNLLQQLLNVEIPATERVNKIIENYFVRFSSISFSDMDKYKETIGILEKIKMISFHGIGSDSEAKKNFMYLYSKYGYEEISKYIIGNVEKILEEMKKGDLTNKETLDAIVLADGHNFIPYFSEEILDVLEQNGFDRNHNSVVDAKIEMLFSVYNQHGSDVAFSPELKEWFSKYVSNIVNREDFNVFNEKWLCNFIQLNECGKLPLEYSEILSKIMQKDEDLTECKKEVLDFISFHKSNSIETEEEFDTFIRKVGRLKLQAGIMPREAVNFILQYVLENDSYISKNPDKYKGLVERVIEDFANWDLAAKVKQNKNYCYFIGDVVVGRTNVNGICIPGKNIVTLRRNLIDKLIKEKDIQILNTVFHENIHAEQFYDFTQSRCENYIRYMALKDTILAEEYKGYYESNYFDDYLEVEARVEALKKLKKYATKLNFDKSHIRLGNGFDKEVFDIIQIELKKENAHIYTDQRNGLSDVKESETIDELFDSLMKRRPELLSIYPSLQLEYKEDGNRKSFDEFLSILMTSKDTMQMCMIKKQIMSHLFSRKDDFKEKMRSLAEFDYKGDKNAETIIAIAISESLTKYVKGKKSSLGAMSKEEIDELYEELKKNFVQIEYENKTKLKCSRAFFVGMEYAKRVENEPPKSPTEQLFELYHQVGLRKIEMDIQTLGKNDLDYDEDIQHTYFSILKSIKQVVEIEEAAVRRGEADNIQIARKIYEKAFANFEKNPWGKAFANDLIEFRREKLEEVHSYKLFKNGVAQKIINGEVSFFEQLTNEELIESYSTFDKLCLEYDCADRENTEKIRTIFESKIRERTAEVKSRLEEIEQHIEIPENDLLKNDLMGNLFQLDPEEYMAYRRKREEREGMEVPQIMMILENIESGAYAQGRGTVQAITFAKINNRYGNGIKEILMGYDALDAHIMKRSEYLETQLEILKRNMHIPGNNERYLSIESELECMQQRWNAVIYKQNLKVNRDGRRVITYGGPGEHEKRRLAEKSERERKERIERLNSEGTTQEEAKGRWKKQFASWYNDTNIIFPNASARFSVMNSVVGEIKKQIGEKENKFNKDSEKDEK